MTTTGTVADGRPGNGFHAGVWANTLLSLAYAVLLAVSIPLLLRDERMVRTVASGTGIDIDALRRLVDEEHTVALLRILVALVYGVAFTLWYRTTRAWVRRRTGDDAGLRRHWAIVVWRGGWLAMVVLSFFGLPQLDGTDAASLAASARHADQVQLLLTVLRLALVVILGFAVWSVRGWVLALPAVEVPADVAAAPAEPGLATSYRRWRERRHTRVYE